MAFTIYNCHASKAQAVDFAWLSKASNDLFNTPTNVHERSMMLRNERNASCEQNCWKAEDNGGISPRLWQHGDVKSHDIVKIAPTIIDLTINSNCNLTCTYCCKEFSSGWLKDIMHKEYAYSAPDIDLINRNTVTLRDTISTKIKQAEFKQSSKYQALLGSIVDYSSELEELIITGGEPFADNNLFDVIEQLELNKTTKLTLFTGLGISFSRFKRYIDTLVKLNGPSILLRISAEGINKHLEFNRYGVKWDDFLKKIAYLKMHKVNFVFHSAISNLSIFGFSDFYNYFKEYEIHTTFVYTPTMMGINVLDVESKTEIKNKISNLPDNLQQQIIRSMNATPTVQQKIQINEFLTQFIERRPELSLDIFPKSFLTWVGL